MKVTSERNESQSPCDNTSGCRSPWRELGSSKDKRRAGMFGPEDFKLSARLPINFTTSWVFSLFLSRRRNVPCEVRRGEDGERSVKRLFLLYGRKHTTPQERRLRGSPGVTHDQFSVSQPISRVIRDSNRNLAPSLSPTSLRPMLRSLSVVVVPPTNVKL